MEREFWINRWVENKIGFHEEEVNPFLKRFWPQVAQSVKGRTLVPLCGKSKDLDWLAGQGGAVVGVDLSEIAARSFGQEQGIVFTEANESGFAVFRGKSIVFYVGDFFEFTSSIGGKFDFFYDRAALIALPSEMRRRYVERLESLLAEKASGLAISLEFDDAYGEGPPFSVNEAEVKALWAGFQVDKVHEYDCLEQEPRFKERGVKWMREVVYEVRRG